MAELHDASTTVEQPNIQPQTIPTSVAGAFITAGSNAMRGINSRLDRDIVEGQIRHDLEEQRTYNEKIAAENRKHAEEFWTKQNIYNSPLNQRKRYAEAGLNAAYLMSGGAQSVGGNFYTPAAPQPVDYQGTRQRVAQTLLTNAETSKSLASASNIDTTSLNNLVTFSMSPLDVKIKANAALLGGLTIEGQSLSNRLNDLNLNLQKTLFTTNVELTQQTLKTAEKQYDILTEGLIKAKFENTLNPTQKSLLENQIRLQDMQLAIGRGTLRLQKAQINLSVSQREQIYKKMLIDDQSIHQMKRENRVNDQFQYSERYKGLLKLNSEITYNNRRSNILGLGKVGVIAGDPAYYEMMFNNAVNDLFPEYKSSSSL